MERESSGGFIPEKFHQATDLANRWALRVREGAAHYINGLAGNVGNPLETIRVRARTIGLVSASFGLYEASQSNFVGFAIGVGVAMACAGTSKSSYEKSQNLETLDSQDGEEIHLNPLDNFSYLIYGEDSPS